MLTKWLTGSSEIRIRELENEINELQEKVSELDKRLFKQHKKNMLMMFRLDLFKGFSPRLWFEYFSPDASKFSHSAKAQKSYEKWLEAETKRRSKDA